MRQSDYIECGSAPSILGEFIPDEPPEMMFYLYLPVKMIGDDQFHIPKRLTRYLPILDAVRQDNFYFKYRYVYLTAKTMFVDPSSPGNRPGWHLDGFGSGGDLNYTWADSNPTQFVIQDFVNIPNNDVKSMTEITDQVQDENIISYPNNSIIKLDETIVHRVNPEVNPCLRSFVKVTISRHKFAKVGNSHNHLIDYNWQLTERNPERNLDHG